MIEPAAVTMLRYLLYLAFVFAAMVFWPLFLGLSMGDPPCLAEGYPCPEPGMAEHAFGILLVYSAKRRRP